MCKWQVVDRQTLRMRIWERGAGETSASGSSSCAVAAVAVKAGWCKSPLRMRMPGGELGVEVDSAFNVRLKGPVEVIGRMDFGVEKLFWSIWKVNKKGIGYRLTGRSKFGTLRQIPRFA